LTKILVADDDFGVVTLLKTLLELEGYQVATTLNGRRIVELLEDEQPDLALIDFYLGREYGLEVLATIRQSPRVAGIPVLLTSALDHSHEAEKAGADGFVLKPFTARELLTAIEQALAGRSEQRADKVR
jgi:CheY-like chemotaxis protein